MKFNNLTNREIQEAISAGVDAAIYRMITGVTSCPSADFWDALKNAMESAFERVAQNEIAKDCIMSKGIDELQSIETELMNISESMLSVAQKMENDCFDKNKTLMDRHALKYLSECIHSMASHYKTD